MTGKKSEIEQPFGGENLEVMTEARNYNNYLRMLIRQFGADADAALDFGAGSVVLA